MLNDLKSGQNFEITVYIASAQEKVSKNGKSYITGDVKDKSAVMRYFLWDSDNISTNLPKAGTYAAISGRLEIFNDNKQINLLSAKSVESTDIDPNDFKKTSSQNIDLMWDELVSYTSNFKDPLISYIADEIITDKIFIKKLKNAPAARSVHNDWVGGLLEHLLGVAKLAEQCSKYYNDNYFNGKLNMDLLIFGAIFHDIGKIWEYDYSTPEIRVTTTGELLGHIYMGSQKISEIANKYIQDMKESGESVDEAVDTRDKILHIVLTHHGKLDWGSPVNPKTPEAILVHYVDNLDTKMMNAWENIKDCKEEFTNKIFIQENVKLLNTMR